MDIQIIKDDLTGSKIHALLTAHLDLMIEISPPESIHALDLDALRVPEICFWTGWDGDELLGCFALKEHDPLQGEIKSMHTALKHRGKGIAAIFVKHIIATARSRGYERLNLETGSMASFAPARALYARHGFMLCGPFADYREDPNSNYMTLEL